MNTVSKFNKSEIIIFDNLTRIVLKDIALYEPDYSNNTLKILLKGVAYGAETIIITFYDVEVFNEKIKELDMCFGKDINTSNKGKPNVPVPPKKPSCQFSEEKYHELIPVLGDNHEYCSRN